MKIDELNKNENFVKVELLINLCFKKPKLNPVIAALFNSFTNIYEENSELNPDSAAWLYNLILISMKNSKLNSDR